MSSGVRKVQSCGDADAVVVTHDDADGVWPDGTGSDVSTLPVLRPIGCVWFRTHVHVRCCPCADYPAAEPCPLFADFSWLPGFVWCGSGRGGMAWWWGWGVSPYPAATTSSFLSTPHFLTPFRLSLFVLALATQARTRRLGNNHTFLSVFVYVSSRWVCRLLRNDGVFLRHGVPADVRPVCLLADVIACADALPSGRLNDRVSHATSLDDTNACHVNDVVCVTPPLCDCAGVIVRL